MLGQRAQVAGHGAGVAPGDRPGQRRVAGVQRVVQRGAEQRPEHPGGLLDAGPAEQVGRLVDQGDEVVRADHEGGMVERARLLRHHHRVAPDLPHQRRGDGQQRRRSGHAERRPGQPVGVLGRAGEGHRRVQGQRERPGPGGRRQHAGAVRAGGVRDELPRPPRAGLGQAGDQRGELVVRDGQQHQVRAGHHLVGGQQRYAGQQPPCAPDGPGGDPGGGDDPVAGPGKRGTEDGADPSGADHADREAGGDAGLCAHHVIQSSSGVPVEITLRPPPRSPGCANPHTVPGPE